MTHFIKIDGVSHMAIQGQTGYLLSTGGYVPNSAAIRDREAEEAYETLKNKVPAVVAYLADKKVSVFHRPDGQYSAWIKGAEVGQSPNPVLALLVAAVMAMEHEGFEGWSDDSECIDAMNALDEAVIKGYHCDVWVDTNKSRQYYYCLVNGGIRAWGLDPLIVLVEGLVA